MTSQLDARGDRRFMVANAAVSSLALAFLAWLLLAPRNIGGGADLSFMPAINATLNALCAVLLSAGYVAIKRRERRLHQRLMISAFCASSLFLIGYVSYHYV